MTLTVDTTVDNSRLRWSAGTMPPDEVGRPHDPALSDVPEELDDVETEDKTLSSVINAATSLVEAHPDSAVALARLAQAHLTFGHRVSARDAALRSLERATRTDHGAIAASVRVLTEIGETERAYELTRGVEIEPSIVSSLLAVSAGALDAAEEQLTRASDPISKAVLGWIRLEQGDFPQAVRLLRAAGRSRNAASSVYTNLGYAYAGTGAWQRAIRSTRYALQLDPDNKIAVTNLTCFLVAIGEPQEALGVLRGFIDAHRDLSLLRLLVEVEIEITGDRLSAKTKLERFRRLAGRDVPAIQSAEIDAEIVMLRQSLNEIDRAVAAKEVRAALERSGYSSAWIARMLAKLLNSPTDAPVLSDVIERLTGSDEDKLPLLTRLAQLRGQFDRAIDFAEQWRKAHPFDPGAPTDLSHMLCDYRSDYEAAIEVASVGLSRSPRFLPLRNNLAYALASAGRTREADRVLVVDEKYPATLATRGFILLMEGDRSAGEAMYKAAAAAAAKYEPEFESLVRSRLLVALVQTGFIDAEEVGSDLTIATETPSVTSSLILALWQRILSKAG